MSCVSSTVRKQTSLVRVPVSAHILCVILPNTQPNCAVTHPLFNYSSKSYLSSIDRVINASDADISVIFRDSFLSLSFSRFSAQSITIERHPWWSAAFSGLLYLVFILSNPNLLLRKLNFRGDSLIFANYTREFMW